MVNFYGFDAFTEEDGVNPLRAALGRANLLPPLSRKSAGPGPTAESYDRLEDGEKDPTPYHDLDANGSALDPDDGPAKAGPARQGPQRSQKDDDELYRENMAAMIGHRSSCYIWGPDHPFRCGACEARAPPEPAVMCPASVWCLQRVAKRCMR